GALDEPGVPVIELFVAAGLCPSKGQARKDLEGGGLYLNNHRLTEIDRRLKATDLLFGKHLLLRKGRKNYVVLSR
ncbi:MAG TPA: tyrosine--tRNA ligase, partial [Verrucomicrobiales bacterium]|nr:tyrosine--tRNA ligase [Verrucomicrobiales bacterium]